MTKAKIKKSKKVKKAKKVLRSKTPKTTDQLLKAIKALGDTPSEISATLIKMGFEKCDQSSTSSCPVCSYLISLGVKSPYVYSNEIGLNDDNVRVFLEEEESLVGMNQFQQLASGGKLACFAGAKIDGLLNTYIP